MGGIMGGSAAVVEAIALLSYRKCLYSTKIFNVKYPCLLQYLINCTLQNLQKKLNVLFTVLCS